MRIWNIVVVVSFYWIFKGKIMHKLLRNFPEYFIINFQMRKFNFLPMLRSTSAAKNQSNRSNALKDVWWKLHVWLLINGDFFTICLIRYFDFSSHSLSLGIFLMSHGMAFSQPCQVKKKSSQNGMINFIENKERQSAYISRNEICFDCL